MQTGLYFNSPDNGATPLDGESSQHHLEKLSLFASEAESLAYDSLLLAEHSMVNTESGSQAYLTIEQLAKTTGSIKLGVADSVIALAEPLTVAERILSAAKQLQGRHIVCVSVGEYEEAFFEHNVPFEQCRDRFEETLDVLAKRFSGGSFEHNGKHFKLSFEASATENNAEEDHLEADIIDSSIWITARDFPTLSSAAARGYSVLPHILSEHRVVVELYQAFTEMLSGHGRDPETLARPIVRDIFVANSNVEAEARALDAYMNAYQGYAENCELIDFKNQPKFPDACSINNLLKHHLVIGDPETVAEQLAEIITQTGCSQIIARMLVPGIELEHALESAALFANHVKPVLDALD